MNTILDIKELATDIGAALFLLGELEPEKVSTNDFITQVYNTYIIRGYKEQEFYMHQYLTEQKIEEYFN